MAQLRQEYQQFVGKDTEVIAVGPENQHDFSAFWRAHKMPFPGIPDPHHHIAMMYGQQVKPFKFGRMPALMVIDKHGLIRYAHYGDSMSDIPTDKDILSLLDEINREPASPTKKR